MSYRKITVNGKDYEYSIGRTHVKFRGGPAVPYIDRSKAVGLLGTDYVFMDSNLRVTPKHIKNYILEHMDVASRGTET